MKILKHCLLIITFYFIIANNSFSQMVDLSQIPAKLGSTNVGKDFWLSFFPNYNSSSTGLYIFVSSKVVTDVTVEVHGKGWSQKKSTIPNQVIMFTIPISIGQPYDFVNTTAPPVEQVYGDAGIHIYSNDEIVVYAVSLTSGSSDGFTVLPTSVLGRSYIVSSWPDTFNNTNQFFPSFTSIVGVYDQTKVYFTLGGNTGSQTRGGLTNGKSTNWTLYKGDVVVIPSAGQNADLTGSIITSSKPVAVIAGNRCGNIPETETACDYLIEQNIPPEAWGNIYHVTPIKTRKKNSYINVFAKEGGTTVYRDGSAIGQLESKGGLLGSGWLHLRADVGTPRPIVISGDKPISVTQFDPSRGDDNTTMDPFQINLVPVEQYQKEFIFTPPQIAGGIGFPLNYVNIIYQSSDMSVIPDDLEIGQVENQVFYWQKLKNFDPNPGKAFIVVNNGPTYYFKTIQISQIGMFGVRANTPIMAYCYGTTNRTAYGYSASIGASNLEKNDTLPPLPTWKMNCEGDIDNGNVTDIPTGLNSSNISTVFYHASLSKNYTFKYDDFIPGDVSKVNWTLDCLDKNQDAQAVITFGDRSGNDTTVVINYYVTKLKINPTTPNYGIIKKGDTLIKDMWLVNQSTTSTKVITNILLKNGVQGYHLYANDLSNLTFPVSIQPNDSIKFKMVFNNSKTGVYLDTINVSDDCTTFELSDLKVQVGGAVIDAQNQTFDDTYIGSSNTQQVIIYNRGLLDLTIDGYQKPDTTIFDVQLPEINAVQTLTIGPNQLYYFNVTFRPQEEKEYSDSIVFFSNTNTLDSVSTLTGNGVKKPSGVNDNNSTDNNFALFPNPVEDELIIQLPSNNYQVISIKIFDTFGNLIDELLNSQKSLTGSNNIHYNTSRLVNGLYFVQLITQEKSETKKFSVFH